MSLLSPLFQVVGVGQEALVINRIRDKRVCQEKWYINLEIRWFAFKLLLHLGQLLRLPWFVDWGEVWMQDRLGLRLRNRIASYLRVWITRVVVRD